MLVKDYYSYFVLEELLDILKLLLGSLIVP